MGGVVPRPGLFEVLQTSARVAVVSAPAGAGKTVLLRSWISEAGLEGRVAWVSVSPDERDPQQFWPAVLGALRQTVPGAALVRELTAAPDLDGWAVVERLLKDLAPLDNPVWLVIDDVHELGSVDIQRQLELLAMRAPPELRFVLATRHDVRLGLHRLRLEGELTEIRPADLRFSLAEARELFAVAGIELAEPALVMLHERTEGWAAGLRLAALSLTGHPDPARFAAEFSGSERTVAEYLLAEVLERQSPEVRRLLLRTSVLERVSGPLADALTGGAGGERVLQELEAANAFVVSLDAARSWFRYHHLFAGLLQLELRRTAPEEVDALHRAAARWFADHGHPVEAVRHAQAARDWASAARLLADHWPGLHLDGQAATVHALLAGFPAEARAADSELAVLAAADELAAGSLEEAERLLGLATGRTASVPVTRRSRLGVLVSMVRLMLARQRMDLPAVAAEAKALRVVADAPDTAPLGLSGDLRALTLITRGIAEYWGARLAEAEPHLEHGIALARRIGRPYLEFLGLAHCTSIASVRSSPYALAEERARQTIELARRHGWTDEPAVGIAYISLAAGLIWRRQHEEAGEWVRRAERTLRAEAEPMTAMAIRYVRALLELARGRDQEVLATFQAAERLSRLLDAPDWPLMRTRALRLHALVRLGETGRAEQDIAEISEQDRDSGEIRMAVAALRIARDDPHAATVALAPVLSGAARVPPTTWLAHAYLLESTARDALGDPTAAGHAMRRALETAASDGALTAFLFHPPTQQLFDRYAPDGSEQATLVGEIRSLLPAEPGPKGFGATEPPRSADPPWLVDPLTQSEIRVLRYLPTNLSAPEIARELFVSVTTVRTHLRHLFIKLGAHRRTEAVAVARALGLLAASPDAHIRGAHSPTALDAPTSTGK
ncbi:LuxR C-terminal-related transcriptional regulator [Streptomyces sp. GESEQ-35]|uniref:helix-turn-helix transcriptional regulator n=1 Tax=Streptomyces sp. GESEQ-35 TaxID=2812657 RepID=UPI001B33734F|nr:LuxR C-terminal-related transcriptional regulator [Streptomyces sp. GESEQ-35]